MSRWVSLNHARAKASANSAGFSWKRREIFSYAGSTRSARSVVSIVGSRFSPPCVRGRDGRLGVLGHPLVRAGRAVGQLPLVAEEDVEEGVVPLGRRRGPRDLEAAR